MGVTCWGALQGKFLFWYFSSKEMIRFHPNLVGIILRGKRSKVAKKTGTCSPQGGPGGGPPRVKTM